MRERLRLIRERLFGGRRVRTPLFLQFEATECGAACLGIILAYFRRWVSLEELRVVCGISRDACSAADIVRAAEGYGLSVTGWRREPHQLQSMALPLILFWEFNHFVVLEGFSRGRYYLNDPANGHRTVSEEEFDRAFTGVVLALERGPDFKPGGGRVGVVRPLWQWLRTVKVPLLFAAPVRVADGPARFGPTRPPQRIRGPCAGQFAGGLLGGLGSRCGRRSRGRDLSDYLFATALSAKN